MNTNNDKNVFGLLALSQDNDTILSENMNSSLLEIFHPKNCRICNTHLVPKLGQNGRHIRELVTIENAMLETNVSMAHRRRDIYTKKQIRRNMNVNVRQV